MDKDKTIALLNQDLEAEHGAIIQYLTHAYAMGEGEMACDIEAISREEMRHLNWLAETIVELGGVPSLKRGKMIMEGKVVADWMRDNVRLETGAINQYKEHIKAIDDPKIKRLLRRIVSDEESHHNDFKHFSDKALKGGAKDLRGTRTDNITKTLNWAVEHEYTAILQYMFQSYMTTNKQVKKQLETQAINEMQHMGWSAEKLVNIGGSPRIEHTDIDQSTETADMLQANISLEPEVAAKYNQAAKETENHDLKNLFIRMRNHEKYHHKVFSDLLKEEERG